MGTPQNQIRTYAIRALTAALIFGPSAWAGPCATFWSRPRTVLDLTSGDALPFTHADEIRAHSARVRRFSAPEIYGHAPPFNAVRLNEYSDLQITDVGLFWQGHASGARLGIFPTGKPVAISNELIALDEGRVNEPTLRLLQLANRPSSHQWPVLGFTELGDGVRLIRPVLAGHYQDTASVEQMIGWEKDYNIQLEVPDAPKFNLIPIGMGEEIALPSTAPVIPLAPVRGWLKQMFPIFITREGRMLNDAASLTRPPDDLLLDQSQLQADWSGPKYWNLYGSANWQRLYHLLQLSSREDVTIYLDWLKENYKGAYLNLVMLPYALDLQGDAEETARIQELRFRLTQVDPNDILAPSELKPLPAMGALTFSNPERLEGHFEKHASEFGVTSAAEYLALANASINGQHGPYDSFLQSTGDTVVVARDDSWYACITSAGHFRTFFRPNRIGTYLFQQVAFRRRLMWYLR